MPSVQARNLRKKTTGAEKLLWEFLRKRRIFGHRFRRQHPIGPFVVDFVCLERRVIIEVDGDVHDHPARRQKDLARDTWLQDQRFRVLHLRNEIIVTDPETALLKIEAFLGMSVDAVLDHPHPNPPPLRGREKRER